VLGLAESMGGLAALRLAFGEDVRTDMSRAAAYPCNFKTGGLIVGSPEAVLIEIIRRDLDRFYRQGSFARALRTMSSAVGIQTAAEKAAGAIASALAGYETWFGGGMIGLDEIFSPIQLMIDCEIRDYALQVVRGFEADEEFDDVAILRDALRSRDDPLPFMTHPSTLATFRNVFREPGLFRRDSYKGQSHPREDLVDRAREEIRRRIESHTYDLAADKAAEIDGIYRQAQAELG
jgi:trimethylamine:corrinoid methyltransferase-like protein